MTNDLPQPGSLQASCRLCGDGVVRAFSLQVLHKYDVEYLKCTNCDSLQTERPYWTSEAYTSNLSILDTGAGQRNLSNLAAAYAVARVLGLKDVLDFGGGDGLLCRLLRDYRINCFVNDKYASATYARAFATPDFLQPAILLAFEVLEHFEDPRADLKALFDLHPRVVVASTCMFSDQGPDWWYLAPDTGQHVFFYSRKALRLIADEYHYSLLICSGYFLFIRPGSSNAAKNHVLKLLLQKHVLRLVSAAMRLIPTRGVMMDFDSLRSRKQ